MHYTWDLLRFKTKPPPDHVKDLSTDSRIDWRLADKIQSSSETTDWNSVCLLGTLTHSLCYFSSSCKTARHKQVAHDIEHLCFHSFQPGDLKWRCYHGHFSQNSSSSLLSFLGLLFVFSFLTPFLPCCTQFCFLCGCHFVTCLPLMSLCPLSCSYKNINN